MRTQAVKNVIQRYNINKCPDQDCNIYNSIVAVLSYTMLKKSYYFA